MRKLISCADPKVSSRLGCPQKFEVFFISISFFVFSSSIYFKDDRGGLDGGLVFTIH